MLSILHGRHRSAINAANCLQGGYKMCAGTFARVGECVTSMSQVRIHTYVQTRRGPGSNGGG